MSPTGPPGRSLSLTGPTENVRADLVHVVPVLDDDEENADRVDHQCQKHQQEQDDERDLVVDLQQRQVEQRNDEHEEKYVVVRRVLERVEVEHDEEADEQLEEERVRVVEQNVVDRRRVLRIFDEIELDPVPKGLLFFGVEVAEAFVVGHLFAFEVRVFLTGILLRRVRVVHLFKIRAKSSTKKMPLVGIEPTTFCLRNNCSAN